MNKKAYSEKFTIYLTMKNRAGLGEEKGSYYSEIGRKYLPSTFRAALSKSKSASKKLRRFTCQRVPRPQANVHFWLVQSERTHVNLPAEYSYSRTPTTGNRLGLVCRDFLNLISVNDEALPKKVYLRITNKRKTR